MRRHFSISDMGRHAVLLAGVLLLGTVPGLAQVTTLPQRSLDSDPFAAYHDALARRADSVLTAPVPRSFDSTGDNAAPAQVMKVTGARAGESLQAVRRVQQLRPLLEPILREEQVPTELAAVVLVESGGHPMALSPKGARGIWQFMPDTARRYGLVVDNARDDRTDVEKSTRAAARYLRDLYAQFGNWSLALAAYNAGELLVANAVTRAGSNDFIAISSKGRIPLETQNYVPAVWTATRRIEENPDSLDRDGSVRSRIVYASGEAHN